MTEQERKVLEHDAARVYPEIAFKIGKIVAIDEILSTLEDAVRDDQGISGKALAVALLLIYGDAKEKISRDVCDRCAPAIR